MSNPSSSPSDGLQGLNPIIAGSTWRDRRAKMFMYGIAALRILFGLVFLTNGLAKVGIDFPILPGFLIDFDGAKNILANNVKDHPVGFYQDLVENVIIDNYTPFGVVLTLTELFIGVTLITGAFASVGALIGGLATLHINFSTLAGYHSGPWAWEEATLWGPLFVIALIGAGRYWGLDYWAGQKLPARLRRWPLTG